MKDHDGRVRGYLCTQFLNSSSFEDIPTDENHRDDNHVSSKRDVSHFSTTV